MRLLRLALSLVAALCLSPFASVSAAPAAVASADAIAVFQVDDDDDGDDDGGAVTALAAQPAAPAVTLPDAGLGPASSATSADLGAVPAVAGVVLAADLLMRRRRAVSSI